MTLMLLQNISRTEQDKQFFLCFTISLLQKKNLSPKIDVQIPVIKCPTKSTSVLILTLKQCETFHSGKLPYKPITAFKLYSWFNCNSYNTETSASFA